MSRNWSVRVALLALLAGLAVLAGCQTKSPILADLFVPLPPTGPVVNQPRHPPPPKAQPIVIVQDEVIKPPDVDWAGIYAMLPRDKKGKVDWMRSLDEKLITPKPGVDPMAEPANTTDEEITFVNDGEPGKPAVFRHATHTQWLNCKNCHSGIFKKRSDNLQFTHDDMEAGKYCGACHFKVVIVQSGCNGCHPKKKAS